MPLSEALAYNVDHLDSAAEHWTKVADHRESTYADVRNRAHGLDWTGDGADAMHDHVDWDFQKAKFSAEDLRDAAGIARSSAGDLHSLHRRLRDNLDDVRNDGFVVGEDYTVLNDRPTRSLDEHLARQQQAVEHTADLRFKATELTDADARVGARLQTATAGEGKIQFTDFKADGGPVCDDPDYEDGIARRIAAATIGGGMAGAAVGIPGGPPAMIVGGVGTAFAGFLGEIALEIAGDGPKCE